MMMSYANLCFSILWGVETHRLARPMPPNWRVGGKNRVNID